MLKESAIQTHPGSALISIRQQFSLAPSLLDSPGDLNSNTGKTYAQVHTQERALLLPCAGNHPPYACLTACPDTLQCISIWFLSQIKVRRYKGEQAIISEYNLQRDIFYSCLGGCTEKCLWETRIEQKYCSKVPWSFYICFLFSLIYSNREK